MSLFLGQLLFCLPKPKPTKSLSCPESSTAWPSLGGGSQNFLARTCRSSHAGLPSPLPRSWPAPAREPHPFWSSCLSSSLSACKPRLDLCKSNIHPSRLSSNISSWRHHVAFCQFEFLLNNCYCKINDRRQSVPTARCTFFFFFTAALIIESRKFHFLSSTYCVHSTKLSPCTVFENSLDFMKEDPFNLHFTDEETDSEM